MNDITKKKIATPTKILNVTLSDLKCIKTVNTRYVFIEAIINAVAIVMPPKLIPATTTVSPVKVIKASQISM